VSQNFHTIAIIGMGYVGLPLALAFADKGISVYGLDIDQEKIEKLRKAESYINYIPDEAITKAGDNLKPTRGFEVITRCDVVIICVPTPLDHHGIPDLSYVRDTAMNIGPHLRGKTLVVLESTTYPGTTRNILRSILLETKPTEADILVAYSPERVDPGNPMPLQTIPKVVGGETPEATGEAADLYSLIFDTIVPVSSCEVAEATKLFENIFRNVNIALVNELKIIFAKMGMDFWEVIDAAETKPYGFMRFNPGPGLGGHCIPVDPFYLSWAVREFGTTAKMIELAGRINSAMPDYVIQRVVEALNSWGRAVNGSRILLLGIAYKPGVNDLRESPSMKIWGKLVLMGALIDFYDPAVPVIPKTRDYPQLAGTQSVVGGVEKRYDVALVLSIDSLTPEVRTLLNLSDAIIDTKNIVPHSSTVWGA